MSLRRSLLLIVALASPNWAAAAQSPSPGTYRGRDAAYWVQQLGNRDQRQRWLAAYALGRIAPRDSQAVAALRGAVTDRNESLIVSRYAVDALGRIGPDAASAAPALAAVIALAANDPFYRRGAARALGRIGPQANETIGTLRRAASDNDQVLRVEAALALYRIQSDPASVKAIADLLTSSDAGARYRAAAALAELGEAARLSGQASLLALSSDDAEVRRGAGRVMGQIGASAARPLVGLLEDANPPARESVVAALGWVLSAARSGVLENPTADAMEREQVATVVRQQVLPALVKQLGDRRGAVRQRAAAALAEGGLWALPALLEVLDSPNHDVQQGAVAALEQLLQSLDAAQIPADRLASARAAVLPQLVAALGQDRHPARYQVVRLFAALGYGPEASAAEGALQSALRDEDARVRRYAARALQQIGASR